MAAGKFKLYDSAKEYIADGTIDLDTDTFHIELYLSSSNANALSNTVLASLTNQHANANGYTTGGIALSGVTWAQVAGTATFDATDPVWTAAGGSIVARFAVIRKAGTANAIVNPLLCVCLLEAVGPADVTATSPNTLTITFSASGIFTLSGAATD